MSRYTGCDWTPAEDAIICRLYPEGGVRTCGDALPHRTWAAIKLRARKLNVRLTPQAWATAVSNGHRGTDPTPEEIAERAREIREQWGAEELNRR